LWRLRSWCCRLLLHPLWEVLEPRVGMRVDADEAREVADVFFELYRRISGPDRACRHRVAHDASRPHERVLADLDARQDRAVPADARTATDDAVDRKSTRLNSSHT